MLENLEGIETMPKVKKEDITPKQILKRGTDEKLNNFLSTTIKISSKKK